MSDGVQRFIADVLSACVVDLAACSSVIVWFVVMTSVVEAFGCITFRDMHH
jgi:hypothetical protein